MRSPRPEPKTRPSWRIDANRFPLGRRSPTLVLATMARRPEESDERPNH
ncbi:hypothetical protein I553_0762 [Mycobacterium xenopi 4042]|uniref:Uncharacterized protein n=1 Tax=Mycobacterium xenopi 4042 TaxID=1299334 RepID=X7YIE1_MYCXE|nr:hypothetical protein I553_0762 [Mycobacterium xenopi 4042]